ncbi:hypothetical protein [Embleya scabrispora]|uniref:hypothetical protein n=1 Tax=Embleya scabrispora TaxID=159449 RepID=UPI001319EE84|nr:hypothetical protein [Embleya scabrispora]MYS81338.1 hypothetical protein [Streptomyces sp. SID5474]
MTASAPAASPSASGSTAHLSTAELKRVLLKKTDMPQGWESIVDTQRDDHESGPSDCERLMAQSNPGSGVYPVLAAASITARDPAPGGKSYALVGSNLTSLSADDAKRSIPAIRDLLPRCVDQQVTTDEFSGRFTARAVEWPSLGEETMALEFVTRADTGQAWVHSIVLVRVGTTLIRVVRVNLTGTTPQHPDEALVRKQVEQVVAGPN